MKAIAIIPGTAGTRLVERPEPSITAPDEVKIRIIRVGICGTDREEVSGGRAQAPAGQKELVIGHEMFGQVAGTGSSVTRVKTGDFAVFTVRRGCGECSPCQMGRADMCQTGQIPRAGHQGNRRLPNGIRRSIKSRMSFSYLPIWRPSGFCSSRFPLSRRPSTRPSACKSCAALKLRRPRTGCSAAGAWWLE